MVLTLQNLRVIVFIALSTTENKIKKSLTQRKHFDKMNKLSQESTNKRTLKTEQ